jgi:hypothetical protein
MYPIATISNPTGRVNFSNIPQTFSHLQLRIFGRSTAAGSAVTQPIQINGDVFGSNYYTHWINGDGASLTSGNSGLTTYLYGHMVANSSTANVFSNQIIDIYDYTSTAKNKTVQMISGYDANGSGSIRISSAVWTSTTAINEVSIDIGNQWATGSRLDIYGISNSPMTGA